MTRGSYRNDSGMTQEYLGDSGRVRDMTMSLFVSTTPKKKTTLLGQVSPFGTTPSEPLAEESNVVEGQIEERKMSVRKK